MIGLLRAAVRLPAVVVVTTSLYLLWLVTRPTALVSPHLAQLTHHSVVSVWAKSLLVIFQAEVTKNGAPPRPPFFLVCNHLSYIDIPVLLAHVDGVFLAKSEISRWPVLGHLARVTGTLFVDRERKADLLRVNEALENSLDSQWGVIVFPEGTSTSGESVLPFKSSIFEVAVRAGCPVYHASVSYRTRPPSPPAHLSVCWWGDMGFVSHFLRLLTLPSIAAEITFGAEPVTGRDRKDLAERAHRALQRHFTPVPRSGEPTILT